MCSFRFHSIKNTFLALFIGSILLTGCTCLCDDPQPDFYYISFLFRNTANENTLEDKIGEKVRLYYLDENANRELVQTWEISETDARSGQVDYFYSSQCEEYQQFFEVEILDKKISGNFKARPFYEKNTCCSKYCYSGIIYHQEIQGRIETRPNFSGSSISFLINL